MAARASAPAAAVAALLLFAAVCGATGAPEAAPDGLSLRLTVRYPAPQLAGAGMDDSNLFIRGDKLGLSWSKGTIVPSAQGGAPDTWEITLPYTPADVGTPLTFKLLVNDQTWQRGANSVVVLPESSASVAVTPWFFTATGKYQYHRNVFSPQLHDTRDLVIYTPPSYYENTYKQYDNPIIMHDGENLFNASTSFGGIAWQCQDTVDKLVTEGQMQEVLIVGVNNDVNRTEEYTYSKDPQYGGGDAEPYLDFLEQTVIPLAAKLYRVPSVAAGEGGAPNGKRWGMIGSSLGGLLSCYAGWTRSHTYDRVGCMSSSFWWNSQDFNNTVLHKLPPGGLPQMTWYLDSGDAGPGNDDKVETLAVRSSLASLGYSSGKQLFYYLDHGGQHNEAYWGQRFHVPMTDLYAPAATPTTPTSA